MFESFVIMLREGIEAALVIGIVLVVLKRSQRRDLERPVFWGLRLAILASIGAAIALHHLPINQGAVVSSLVVFVAVGAVYARELAPKGVSPPEPVSIEEEEAVVPLEKFDDGMLHRLGLLLDGRMVRFLGMKTSDGKIRVTLDACEICGPFGYIYEAHQLLCLNCMAEINPLTLGLPGGCNPIPLKAKITETQVRVPLAELRKHAGLFADQPGREEIDPVCGMRVRINDATGFATVNGKTHYFCNTKCQELFQATPADYGK